VSVYLDASALVPTLIEQNGTKAVDEFLSATNDLLVVSDLAAAEVTSALSRLVRMGRLGRDQAAALLDEFDTWRADAATMIDFLPTDFRQARLFVREFDLGLRAPDALHAAICRRTGDLMVTLDRRLAMAAATLGVAAECLA
jgi:uncharacterized protein